MVKLGELEPFQDHIDHNTISTMKPKKNECNGYDFLRVCMKNAKIKIHKDLPATDMWTYEGQYPGPTIEVHRKQKVVAEWKNEIDGVIPFTAVNEPNNDPDTTTQNDVGVSGSAKKEDGIDKLKAWSVVHLHGGKTHPDSDGWTENVIERGQSTLFTYHNDQRARMLWYHDHAMGVTRFNVFAGLAGLWLIRDDEEEKLNLPSSKYELPLLIQDRNLETDGDPDGNLTGRLLHKVEDNAMEFFGPVTLVNGKIWPFCEVEPRRYRVRLINGSNARIYRLLLIDENKKQINDAITQIGSDGGLLPKPIPFQSDEGIVIAPAERVDLIIDFNQIQNGGSKDVKFINNAGAPFDGSPAAPSDFVIGDNTQTGDKTINARLKYPNVMKFCIRSNSHNGHGGDYVIPNKLSELKIVTHNDLPATHCHRVVFLAEINGMLELVELIEVMVKKPTEKYIEIKDHVGKTTLYQVGARMFEDRVNWFPKKNEWEVWKVINATMDTHPFHVHLTDFQILRRDLYDLHDNASLNLVEGFTEDNKPVSFKAQRKIDDKTGVADSSGFSMSVAILKDTIRVNPGENPNNPDDNELDETTGTTKYGEMLTIAIKFEEFTGRYMYHCHLLEHEDHEMMRPFVVLPQDIADMMPHMGDCHHTHTHSHMENM